MSALPRVRREHRARTSPRVSVVTPFLNAERFLAESIDSVLAQDFHDLELILVDDGSTDGSTAIARDYAARYHPVVRYLEHEQHQNRGISVSRNRALSAAIGELIAFIDSDDVWEQTKLAEQIAIMDAYPEVGLVCGAPRYWNSWNGGVDNVVPTGHVANAPVPCPESAWELYPLGKASSPCTSDIMVRRDLATAVGGFEEHFLGKAELYEDQGFFLKVFLTAPLYFSDRVWLNYRLHPASCVATINRDGGYHQARRYFLIWLEQYIASRPGTDRRVHQALQRSLFRYRHPLLYAAAEKSSLLLQRGRRGAARVWPLSAGPFRA